jgi:DnaJ-class molecular chaperone
MTEDYYLLLKIRRAATQDEVKRAFHKLALELHPDVNHDPKTQERFKEITQAYTVLSDIEKRRMYDMRVDPFSPKPAARGAGGFSFGNIFDDSFLRDLFGNLENSNGSFVRTMSDIFNSTTAGKSDSEKLHDAMVFGMIHEMNALLGAGVVPAEKTLKYFVKAKDAARVETCIKHGAQPTPEMLDIAKHNKDRATKKILQAVLPKEEKKRRFSLHRRRSSP